MDGNNEANREFLREQREAYGSMVNNVVKAIGDLSIEVAKQATILTEHDRKLDTAVAEMRARVEAKEEEQ